MNKIGTRFRCEECNSQAVVTHQGDGALQCCGKEMIAASEGGSAQAGGGNG